MSTQQAVHPTSDSVGSRSSADPNPLEGTPKLVMALAEVDLGHDVFPCRSGQKKPAVRHGFKNASRDRTKVTEAWTKQPSLNVGIRTGAESGIVVLDVDGDQGWASLKELERRHGRLPWTRKVETPSGGAHLYFRHPGIEVRCSTNTELGLDVRGDGGYVLGLGSVVDGKPYALAEDEPIAELPEWLLGRMLQNCWDPEIELCPEVLDTSIAVETGVHRGQSRSSKPSVLTAEDEGETEDGGPDRKRLRDPETVAQVLNLLGRPRVLRGSDFAEFCCPIADHEDTRPSAGLYLSQLGQWRFKCHACDENMSLVQLYASVQTGRRVTFRGPTAAQWLRRMWHEAGIDPVEVQEVDLPADPTPATRKVAEGFVLLRALRRHHGDTDYVPFTYDFATEWCGVSRSTAQRAMQELRDCGFLRVKESPPGMRCGLLYDLGEAVAQDPTNPYATVVPWVVFGDDGRPFGLPVDESVPLVGGESVGGPLLRDVVRQERDPVPLEMDGPGLSGRVEVDPGGRSVDEGDHLQHVAEVGAAEGVVRLRGLDAPGGPAEGVVQVRDGTPWRRRSHDLDRELDERLGREARGTGLTRPPVTTELLDRGSKC